MSSTETICAIATPPGIGGVGIIRVSGAQSKNILKSVIGSLPEPRKAVLREIRDTDNQILDQALIVSFDEPHSFTGEDIIELHCHGGQVVLQLVQQVLIKKGARLARPGEFTERAFLNDKLDLTQAEAIADLIHAGSEAAVRAANRSLEGGLSKPVKKLQEGLIELRVWVEAALDFPDEEIDFLEDERVIVKLTKLTEKTIQLLQQARSGTKLTQGARLAILGPPNAGKSSLLNALVKHDAAIVTDIPGTTRDVLRERLEIGGIPMEIIDTAGLRESHDPIEVEGMRRAKLTLKNADIVLWLVDLTSESKIKPPKTDLPILRVGNKLDLLDVGCLISTATDINLSAKTGLGMDQLEPIISKMLNIQHMDQQAFSARPRHVAALEEVSEKLKVARKHIPKAGELLAEELLTAQEALSEITGEYHNDDLLGAIFSSFCIVK